MPGLCFFVSVNMNRTDSLDARLSSFVSLSVALAVTMDEATSLTVCAPDASLAQGFFLIVLAFGLFSLVEGLTRFTMSVAHTDSVFCLVYSVQSMHTYRFKLAVFTDGSEYKGDTSIHAEGTNLGGGQFSQNRLTRNRMRVCCLLFTYSPRGMTKPKLSNLPREFQRFGVLRNFCARVRTYLG